MGGILGEGGSERQPVLGRAPHFPGRGPGSVSEVLFGTRVGCGWEVVQGREDRPCRVRDPAWAISFLPDKVSGALPLPSAGNRSQASLRKVTSPEITGGSKFTSVPRTQTAIHPWMAQVWTAQIHLRISVFPLICYTAVWGLNPWIKNHRYRYGTVASIPQTQGGRYHIHSCICAQSCLTFATPGTGLHEIFRWSRLPFPSPRDPPDPGSEPKSPALSHLGSLPCINTLPSVK